MILSILPFVIVNQNATKETVNPNRTKEHPTQKTYANDLKAIDGIHIV